MNITITDLKKEIESHNNDKFQLINKKKALDAQSSEKISTQRNLSMVLTAFIASVKFDEDQAESKGIAEALKLHMTITKKTPLVGQQLTGHQTDGSTVTLRHPLTTDMLKKLGTYKSNYDTCMQAQERCDTISTQFINSEKEHGNIGSIIAKINTVQTNIDHCTNKIEQIQTAFKALDDEFTEYTQANKASDMQILTSTSCDNKPLMETEQIEHLTEVLLKAHHNVAAIFSQNLDVNFMSRIIREVTQEVHRIKKELVQFQHVEVLDSCLKQLNRDLHNAKLLYNNEQAKLTQQSAKVSKRPMSPLSPMVNLLQYNPLPQMTTLTNLESLI